MRYVFFQCFSFQNVSSRNFFMFSDSRQNFSFFFSTCQSKLKYEGDESYEATARGGKLGSRKFAVKEMDFWVRTSHDEDPCGKKFVIHLYVESPHRRDGDELQTLVQ